MKLFNALTFLSAIYTCIIYVCQQKEVTSALPKLIKLNPMVVKEVFNRLMGAHSELKKMGSCSMSLMMTLPLLEQIASRVDRRWCRHRRSLSIKGLTRVSAGIFSLTFSCVLTSPVYDSCECVSDYTEHYDTSLVLLLLGNKGVF